MIRLNLILLSICWTASTVLAADFTADLEAADSLVLAFTCKTADLKAEDITFDPELKIKNLIIQGNRAFISLEKPVDIKQNYQIYIHGYGCAPFRLKGALDDFYSGEPLGCLAQDSTTSFALFAPRAEKVQIEIFNPSLTLLYCLQMQETRNGIWKTTVEQDLTGEYYGYRIYGNMSFGELFRPEILIADPYSAAIMTRNDFHHRALTLIIDETFDWNNDSCLAIDWLDLLVYEMHIRDLTAHYSSGVPANLRGGYLGLTDTNAIGGINHLKTLGINAVELLPAQEFANIEIPYLVEIDGILNDWNPYARNHWGYMTSGFFAPESYYASDGSLKSGECCGKSGLAVSEFKQMVKALHQAGLAVIMDVVYNHTSQYDYNPLKYIDKKYYYQLDRDNRFLSYSGCGNDLNTSRPMMQRLIIDSLKKWLVDYHIDGFRFDLAAMIDGQTLEDIRDELTMINPQVILIAEPWGGGRYDPAGMSQLGYAAWNDVFRNTIKGQNPSDRRGFIFGELWGGTDLKKLQSLICGYLTAEGGFFQNAKHSLNYLESHDDYTLGDFIRLGLNEISQSDSITDLHSHNKLDAKQMQLNKLAAFILLTAKGPIMLAEGQEYARSKVIAHTSAPDGRIGRIDHNSYEKDNETNWLNYQLMQDNSELADFYRQLIKFRTGHPLLRHSEREQYRFITGSNNLSFGFIISGANNSIIVLYNGSVKETAEFTIQMANLKCGFWRQSIKYFENQAKNTLLTLSPSSGCILVDY